MPLVDQAGTWLEHMSSAHRHSNLVSWGVACIRSSQAGMLTGALNPKPWHLEDVLVEVLLQAFVRQVDAQLLEGVDGEGFEAVDVEDADHPLLAVF